MANKVNKANKRIPSYPSVSGEDPVKMMIGRSGPCMQLTYMNSLTLQEMKLLYSILVRIDPEDPESGHISLSGGDIECLCGGDCAGSGELERRLRHLCTCLMFYDPDAPGRFSVFSLFESTEGSWDDASGTWAVDLVCSDALKKYYIFIRRFFRSELQRVMNLKNPHAHGLFMYLGKNRFHDKWRESLKKLRKELSCDGEIYDDFEYFNGTVLYPAWKELEEKSGCHCTYTPVSRDGETITAVEFRYLPDGTDIPELQPAATPEAAPDKSGNRPARGEGSGKEEFLPDTLISFMHETAPEYSTAQLALLQGLVFSVPDSLKPVEVFPDDPYFPAQTLADSAYFERKYREVRYYSESAAKRGFPFTNEFLYLKACIFHDTVSRKAD